MQGQKLELAIDSIRVRFGSQALTRAAELPPPQAWSSGTPVDSLTGIGGLPRGRLSLFIGSGTCGKLTLALSLLANATHEFAHSIVIDAGGFDPQSLLPFSGAWRADPRLRAGSSNSGGYAGASPSSAGGLFPLLQGGLRALAWSALV